MKFQNLFVYFFILLPCVFFGDAEAKLFNCQIKVAELVEKFQFDVLKDKEGTGGSFNDRVYFISIIEGKISVRVQDSKTASQVQSSFNISRKKFNLSQTPGFDLTCVFSPVEEVKKETPKSELKFTEEVALEKLQADINFRVSTAFPIKYNIGAAGQGRMRSVIFQKGRMYTLDDDAKRELGGNWCLFQVKLELDQDTKINEGDTWQTVQYSTLNNSSSHTVYAYSFVDPAQGKVTQRFSRYMPFNLACQVKKGEIFNQKMWREITGDRIKLYHSP